MSPFKRFCRILAVPMAAVMFLVSVPLGVAQAELIGTEQVIDRAQARANRQKVMDFMKRREVRRQIESFGVDPDEAAARVKNLSDREIAQIAGKIDELPAGGWHVVGFVVGVIVLVLLILVVTDLLGLTDVFPFIRPVNKKR